MTDLERRGALKVFAGGSVAASLGLSVPGIKSGALRAPEPEEAALPRADNPYWKHDILDYLKLYSYDGTTGQVPAHIAPLKSVKPWAKAIIARHYEKRRNGFMQKVADAIDNI